MEAVKKRCRDRRSIDEVRDRYNEWIGKMWDPHYAQRRNWFEETNELLRCAFVRTATEPRPRVPARPGPLVGADRETLGAELLHLCGVLRAYATALHAYARVIHIASSLTCRNQTGGLLEKLRVAIGQLSTMPSVDGDYKEICREVTKWAKRFHRSTEAFAVWEDRMDRCLNNRVPNCPPQLTEEGTAAIEQVSPVPWPPWEDYADE